MKNASSKPPKRPGRGAATRNPRKVVLIVSEGDVTEPQYIRGAHSLWDNKSISPIVFGGYGDPVSVVKAAIRFRKSEKLRKGEQTWAVFDVDPDVNVDRTERVKEARALAKKNSIVVAVSNPCIELWLVLHFDSAPGGKSCDKFLNMLRKRIPNYRKHVDFARDYAARYLDAVSEAKALDDLATELDEPGRNPTTDFFRLMEVIRTSE